MSPKILIAFFVALGLSNAASAQNHEATFGDVKRAYAGQRVVIRDVVTSRGLLNWHFAKSSDSPDYFNSVPSSYLGARGVISLIAIDGSQATAAKVNALGETVSQDDKQNPYLSFLVKLDSGQTLITKTYPGIIYTILELDSDKVDQDKWIESHIASLVGKQVFAVGYTHLYKPDSTLEELVDLRGSQRKRLLSFKRLEPMTITIAKYFPIPEVVLFKLSSDDGTTYFAKGSISDSKIDTSQSILSALVTGLMSSMPPLTVPELKAVKAGSIFRGESKEAVIETLGFPEKENDWGRGGKQMIYLSLTVYTDEKEKVTDWQQMDSN